MQGKPEVRSAERSLSPQIDDISTNSQTCGVNIGGKLGSDLVRNFIDRGQSGKMGVHEAEVLSMGETWEGCLL